MKISSLLCLQKSEMLFDGCDDLASQNGFVRLLAGLSDIYKKSHI